MKTFQYAQDLKPWGNHHWSTAVRLEGGSEFPVLYIKHSSRHANVAINHAIGTEMLNREGVVLIKSRSQYFLLEAFELNQLLIKHGAFTKKTNEAESYWLLSREHLGEEFLVECLGRAEELKPKVQWTQFKFAESDRAFEEVRDSLGMVSTFYNPTTARILKELPPEFDLVMIDRSENTIWLGRKN